MSLKIIGAGFGRTGTTSLMAALEELGFGRCYHMSEVFSRPSHPKFWEQALSRINTNGEIENKGSDIDWAEIFDKYQSTVDWPGCTFYRELMIAYPDAKVLLSVRDPDRWHASALATIYRFPKSLFGRMINMTVPHLRVMYRMIEQLIWQGTFDGKFADKHHAIAVFNALNDSVVAHVRAEQLLVFNVKEGWEPLCKFLDVEIPDTPFSHLNDKNMIIRAMRWGPITIGVVVAAMFSLPVG